MLICLALLENLRRYCFQTLFNKYIFLVFMKYENKKTYQKLTGDDQLQRFYTTNIKENPLYLFISLETVIFYLEKLRLVVYEQR